MYELISRAAASNPDVVAVTHGSNVTTYRELLEMADRAAERFLDAGITRFAIIDPAPQHVLALLGAASRVGIEGCVYPPTASPELVTELLAAFHHDVVLTAMRTVDARLVVAPADWIKPGSPPPGDLPTPAQRPHLILTTGTTGRPKGVRHDWDRLTKAARSSEPRPDERWLLAYGMNQFGGLQVLLHVAGIGATLIATSEFSPRLGLQSLRASGVTHASATPTYWRFVLAEMAADRRSVPDLQQITLGGEAPSDSILNDLRSAFPAARLTQIYAANEFGPARTVRDGVRGLPLRSSSADGEDVELQVRDGELWIRSRVGMLGYYGEVPAASEDWRATGDLVEIIDDRIVFRGRTSDVINVGGVKVHPLPVEERVDALASVAASRVFGRPNALTGAVVAVEFVSAANVDPSEIPRQIREACADLPPASRPRSIKEVPAIRTVDHKIVRTAESSTETKD